MFERVVCSLVFVIFALPLACGGQTGGAANSAEQPVKGHEPKRYALYVPGEVLVKFREKMNRAEVEEFAAKHNCRLEESVATIQLYRMKILDGRDVLEVANAFGKEVKVEYAEPNFIDQPEGDNSFRN